MNTPRIEIEASAELLADLRHAVRMSHNAQALRLLLAEVERAHCVAKRYDEQQISLPLPRT